MDYTQLVISNFKNTRREPLEQVLSEDEYYSDMQGLHFPKWNLMETARSLIEKFSNGFRGNPSLREKIL